MMYKITLSKRAEKELHYFSRKDRQCYKKALSLMAEAVRHPYSGRGNPEPLKYDLAGCWSRRISDEHRLVYSVHEEVIMVHILSARYHYEK